MDRPMFNGFRFGFGATLGVIAAVALCMFVVAYSIGSQQERAFGQIESALAAQGR